MVVQCKKTIKNEGPFSDKLMSVISIISFYHDGTWFYDEGRYLHIVPPSSIYYWIVVQKVFSLLITISVYCGGPMANGLEGRELFPRVFRIYRGDSREV